MDEKKAIREYFEGLKPAEVGLRGKNVRVSLVKDIGIGSNNAGFLVVANGKKFNFRLNMLVHSKNKSRAEFDSLKLVERLGIAPKAWILDDSRKKFDSDFIILDYLEGKPLDKINYSLNDKLVRAVARLCVKFHLMPLAGELAKLPKDETSYEDLLKSIYERYHSLTKLVSNKQFLNLIKESYNGLAENSLRNRHSHPVVLVHGDIAEQNIIVKNGKFKLIDFEGMAISEPAADIAYIFTQFGGKGFDESSRNVFFDEYFKHRKDSSLRERVNVFIPLKNFSDLLWAIGQALKIKNGLLHRHSLEKHKLAYAVAYAQKVFGRCVRDGTIEVKYQNFDLKEVFR